MTLQLHCKRSKIFIKPDGDSHKSVKCARGETTPVPDWVKNDPGYANGIKDGSIIDLTPPAPAKPTPSKPKDVEPEPEPEPAPEEEGDEEKVPTDDAPPAPPAKKSNVPKGLQGAAATTVVKTR
jgi:hypothetical protein